MEIQTMKDFAIEIKRLKSFTDECKKTSQEIMTSSTASVNSSLASPGDSGVQLLDSESEMTSVMSVSGIGCDLDLIPQLEIDYVTQSDKENQKLDMEVQNSKDFKETKIKVNGATLIVEILECSGDLSYDEKQDVSKDTADEMTKSDIVNQNVTLHERPKLSSSAAASQCINSYPIKNGKGFVQDLIENKDCVLQMDDVKINGDKVEDLMNVSLNSYELLDYTQQNKINVKPEKSDEMHVSLSEEVNESLRASLANAEMIEPPQEIQAPADEQIVFRRQRKKKMKSDTPKKRVSFHEDILNSTKVDDVHINHGFVTIEPGVSMSFFQRGFKRKPDVVRGRYSWAAEGDAPYYESNNKREVKSDIYVHTARYSSTSSSSSASITSSIDEEDSSNSNDSENSNDKKELTEKMPKYSCLKKTKSNYIDTNIVQEDSSLKRKKSESNLLDSNIFGSLKNILNFSTSVSIAERGVPEGQEDIMVYSTSYDSKSRRSSGNFDTEIPAPVKKIGNLNIELTKSNLKLTTSEGFYPNYPLTQNLPPNIILCDSNVYEHKGISYSYEYDNFKKIFEQQKPKSSTIYQTILKEFNIFKRKAKEEKTNDYDDFEFLKVLTPIKELQKVESEDLASKSNSNQCSSTTKLDWSDSETISDSTENTSTKHLNSPKHKINKANHYALQNFKFESSDTRGEMHSSKSLPNLRPSSSKSCLINRFLRNVTIKKMIDLKQQNQEKYRRKYVGLYVKGIQLEKEMNDGIDRQLVEEIANARHSINHIDKDVDLMLEFRFKRELFRNKEENLIRIFQVHSAYTTSGETKPLIVVLSNTTFYVAGHKPNDSYRNHFVLPFTELNTILVGPHAQTIHISNYDNDMQCFLTTGCGNLTGDLISQLEMSMRRDKNKPKLPAIKQLTLRDMINLRRSICKQTSVNKDEEYFHYSIVNLQEYNTEFSDTPLGPNKEGPLMFKISESEARWETAYFILKAGVLYMLSSPSYRVPMRVLPLINGACQGARRIYNYPRPHTFQISIGSTTLHLAAPDEFVASEWLQALVLAASGTYNNKEKVLAQSCSLLMTSDHILTVREAFPCNISSMITRNSHEPIKGAQALSCASISDITAFRLPSAEHSWCILEFSCREVHESSGDWILYFSSNLELENFISTLEMLWAYHNENDDSFPLSTIPETDLLNKRCVETYNALQNAWSFLSPMTRSFN